MPANYVLLEKITVGAAGASSVTFSGIPQTGYTDLVLKTSTRNTNAVNLVNYRLNFNGSSAITINEQLLYGDGSNPGWANPTQTGGNTYGFSTGASATANTFASNEYYIPNYTSSNNKSVSIDMAHENNGTTAYVGIDATLWSSSAAITSITLTPTTVSIGQYSTFYLYGVAKLGTTPAIVPYATGGDTIMTDGTYWYHTFLSSGTFTPAKGLTCDYLVVAGGAGGGGDGGGGGGAGGLRSTVTATGGGGSLESALSLASGTGYTVTVGAGGAGGLNEAPGSNGSNSVFSTITSTGGGGGGASDNTPSTDRDGKAGGSGGGGSYFGGAGAAGAGTANQGRTGGTGFESGADNGAGGGGGAGVAGTNGVSNVSGTGGAGVAVSISGSSVTYAGGGGGGGSFSYNGAAGGSGGGGNGGTSSGAGSAGTANTGGGGGGAGRGIGGGAGGSGIVIVRYTV